LDPLTRATSSTGEVIFTCCLLLHLPARLVLCWNSTRLAEEAQGKQKDEACTDTEGHGQGVGCTHPHCFRVSSSALFSHLLHRHDHRRTNSSRLSFLQSRDNRREEIRESGLHPTSTLGAAVFQQHVLSLFPRPVPSNHAPLPPCWTQQSFRRCYFWDQLESKFTDSPYPLLFLALSMTFSFPSTPPSLGNRNGCRLPIPPGQIAGPVSRPVFYFSLLLWSFRLVSLGCAQYGT
jgi:hypothetical protein